MIKLLTVKELYERVGDYLAAINGNDGSDLVEFRLNDPRFKGTLIIKDIRPSILPGCGCWDGMVFDLEFTAE